MCPAPKPLSPPLVACESPPYAAPKPLHHSGASSLRLRSPPRFPLGGRGRTRRSPVISSPLGWGPRRAPTTRPRRTINCSTASPTPPARHQSIPPLARSRVHPPPLDIRRCLSPHPPAHASPSLIRSPMPPAGHLPALLRARACIEACNPSQEDIHIHIYVYMYIVRRYVMCTYVCAVVHIARD